MSAPPPQTKRFLGKTYDTSLGLSDLGARMLANDLGRFLAPDPVRAVDPVSSQEIEALTHHPQRLNVYAYGANNPMRFVGPDGRLLWDIADVRFFGYSVYRFVTEPSWTTGIDMVGDGIGLIPVIPALGTIRRVGQEVVETAAAQASKVAKSAG